MDSTTISMHIVTFLLHGDSQQTNKNTTIDKFLQQSSQIPEPTAERSLLNRSATKCRKFHAEVHNNRQNQPEK